MIPARARLVLLPALVAAVSLAAGCRSPEAPSGGAAAAPPGKAPTAAPTQGPPAGMVRIPGGTFVMGTDHSSFAYETPAHEVTLDPFYIDTTEVTNAQFARFVKATGYVTAAEKWKWSAVFDYRTNTWGRADGADWRHPDGAASSIAKKENFPVVQVDYDDALAYAAWAGKRLPTEAEWELAARGKLPAAKYPWGNDLQPKGRLMANYWQGRFLGPGARPVPGQPPAKDLAEDGYRGIAPVGRFPPNGYGLYDVAGNVWEWVADRFSPDYYLTGPPRNPRGPEAPPRGPRGPDGGAESEEVEYVIRGGSFLCAETYCQGYRVVARNKNTADSATNHQGFRCARNL